MIDDATLTSGNGSKGSFHEEDNDVIIIYAPAGKLGLMIDNPDDGPPVVHSLKRDSVLIDQVWAGDRVLAIDEIDVRHVSSVHISDLISERRDHPVRQLTLLRQKPDKEVISNIATMSNIDTDGDCDSDEFSDVLSLEDVGRYR
jgi:hypothetical protein